MLYGCTVNKAIAQQRAAVTWGKWNSGKVSEMRPVSYRCLSRFTKNGICICNFCIKFKCLVKAEVRIETQKWKCQHECDCLDFFTSICVSDISRCRKGKNTVLNIVSETLLCCCSGPQTCRTFVFHPNRWPASKPLPTVRAVNHRLTHQCRFISCVWGI